MSGKHLPLAERFWAKVRVAGANECWEWSASRTVHGYGQITIGTGEAKKPYRASRVSWELHNGPIPDGLHICHRCDNPPCVNPAHLFLGTPAENAADKVSKGRARGPSIGCGMQNNTKLTLEQVIAIRQTSGPQSEVAAQFGIHQSQVSRIRSGRRWPS